MPQDLGRDAGNGLVLLPADDDDEHHYEQGGTKADGAQVEMEVEGGEGWIDEAIMDLRVTVCFDATFNFQVGKTEAKWAGECWT